MLSESQTIRKHLSTALCTVQQSPGVSQSFHHPFRTVEAESLSRCISRRTWRAMINHFALSASALSTPSLRKAGGMPQLQVCTT
jgi:aspartyl/asparaginyl beta-hydroxylase (cupin superfamily)